jgi:hypothetical protein
MTALRGSTGGRNAGLVSRAQRSVSIANVALQSRDPVYVERKLGPASAAHHFATLALRRVRGTRRYPCLIARHCAGFPGGFGIHKRGAQQQIEHQAVEAMP